MPIGNGVLFAAYGVDPGLWFSDGTETGTRRLSEQLPASSNITSLTPFNGKVYFISENRPGYQLWQTDGTVEGTRTVIDLYPEFTSDVSTWDIAVSGDLLYFTGVDAAHGSELWASDGTAEGTRRVSDLAEGVNHSRPWQFTPVGANLAFRAEDGSGHGLFITDGQNVERLFEGQVSRHAVAVDGKLLFGATTSETGYELWVSDGTFAGTAMLADVNPGADSSSPSWSITYGGKVYFVANAGPGRGAEVWSTDGTAAGTSRLADINPQGDVVALDANGTPGYWSPQIFGGQLYFNANDGFHGEELWTTDGTEAGTKLALDLLSIGNSSTPDDFVADGIGGAFFTAVEADGSRDVWHTEGTEGTTHRVADVPAGSGSSSVPDRLTMIGETLFFEKYGSIYRTDKTKSEAEAVAAGRDLTVVGQTIFYTAVDASDFTRSLWMSDGSPGSAVPVAPLESNAFSSPVDLNGTLYFLGYSGGRAALWKSDGTTAGTVVVKQLPATFAEQLVVAGDRLFFVADGDPDQYSRDYELWVSDGTEAGSVRVADIQPGPRGSFPRELTAAGDRVFFTATQSGTYRELWVSDGTATGTYLVKNIFPEPDGLPTTRAPGRLVAVDESVFFVAEDNLEVPQLWTSDGTEAGTVRVTSFPTRGYREPVPLADYKGVLYFSADDGTSGLKLWASDGTADNTRLLDESTSNPVAVIGSGKRILMSAYRVEAGTELFSHRVADFIAPEVIATSFEFEQRQAITFSFSEDISSFAPEDLLLQNLTTGQFIPADSIAVAYDASTRTATVTFSGLPGGVLPDGNYTATLPAGSVEDLAGNPLGEDFTLDFFVLAGDTDRDRDVDFFDFLKLRSNYGTSGKLFSDGDFDYDGDVDFFDFLILRGNYGVTLPPPEGSGSLFDDGEGSGGL